MSYITNAHMVTVVKKWQMFHWKMLEKSLFYTWYALNDEIKIAIRKVIGA